MRRSIRRNHAVSWFQTFVTSVATCQIARTSDCATPWRHRGLPTPTGGRVEPCRRLLTGLNWSPTLVDPFRAFSGLGVGLSGLLGQLHVGPNDPVTVVVHLACPMLPFTDRGKSSLE